jgi:hypothetical protein
MIALIIREHSIMKIPYGNNDIPGKITPDTKAKQNPTRMHTLTLVVWANENTSPTVARGSLPSFFSSFPSGALSAGASGDGAVPFVISSHSEMMDEEDDDDAAVASIKILL